MITIYRRHAGDCKVHLLRLTPKEKRYFKDCHCPIWICGDTETDTYPRQSLKTRDWRIAETKLSAILKGTQDHVHEGFTIQECIDKYLDSRILSPKTRGQFELVLGRLKEFLETGNVSRIQHLTVDLCEDFLSYRVKVFKSTTAATHYAKLRAFLVEAHRRDWIKTPIHSRLRAITAVYEPKQPYTEDEVAAILQGAESLKGGTFGFATIPKTFRLLLELMLETGMRVSDAVLFDPRKLARANSFWMYSFVPQKNREDKQKKVLHVYLTERLKSEIENASWFSEQLPFVYRTSSDPDTLTQAVLERMQNIGEREGIDKCGPHRLRHTFAVRLLSKGVSLDDVSKLLGHASVSVTEKHYAPWVLSRQLRLARVLAESGVHSVGN